MTGIIYQARFFCLDGYINSFARAVMALFALVVIAGALLGLSLFVLAVGHLELRERVHQLTLIVARMQDGGDKLDSRSLAFTPARRGLLGLRSGRGLGG